MGEKRRTDCDSAYQYCHTIHKHRDADHNRDEKPIAVKVLMFREDPAFVKGNIKLRGMRNNFPMSSSPMVAGKEFVDIFSHVNDEH